MTTNDTDIAAVKVGPFIVGSASARRPETAQGRHNRHWCWVFTFVLIVTTAAPLVGVALILGAAVVIATMTAPPADKGASHDRAQH